MKYQFEGEIYEYREKLTVEEAMELYDLSGGTTPPQLDRALALQIPAAVAAWMFLLMRRAGVHTTWDQVKKMDATSFQLIPEGTELAEAKKRLEESGKLLAQLEEMEQAEDSSAKANAAPKPSANGKIPKRATSRTS